LTPPAFSVVISTHDRPAQLEACLAALPRAAFPRDRFEVVVIDDGGRAQLEGIIASFRDRLTISLAAQSNAGPASGRNHGARLARHPYLAFTDDDCEPEPDWLPALARRCERSPDALVGGRTVNALRHNAYSCASQFVLDMAYAFYNADPANGRFFASNNVAVGTDLFWKCGGFDERFRFSEDRELCDRWRFQGWQLVYEPEAIVAHRHALTFGSFWRQHSQYGRGAAQFHDVCAARHSGQLRDHLGFHTNLPRWWRRAMATGEHPGRPARIIPRLALWQLANATGYVSERLRSGLRRHRSATTWKTP
jgi:GT2 family glycosyltransferase